jgi:NAD(P)-dependent dehydrogenase (short-subunit alcohol dehydrogenase family)
MIDRFSMKGRRALVTGASMSIGRSLAVAFADHGAAVALHHSTLADARAGLPDAAREALVEVERREVEACLVDGDLAEVGSGTRVVERAIAALGGIDVLVVCASIQVRTPFLDVTAAEIEPPGRDRLPRDDSSCSRRRCRRCASAAGAAC